jgi:hypothetical protein
MSEEPVADDDPTVAVGRLRGKRATFVVVCVVSVAFIVSSTVQITRAVFSVAVVPLPSGALLGSPEQVCAEGIRGLSRALERASGRLSSVASAADDAQTMAALRPSLSPEWDRADDVRAACDRAQGGPSAWAALQRLRVAEEQAGRLGREGLSSVRRDVAAHLPADLR